jgi:hypothetical protein
LWSSFEWQDLHFNKRFAHGSMFLLV